MPPPVGPAHPRNRRRRARARCGRSKASVSSATQGGVSIIARTICELGPPNLGDFDCHAAGATWAARGCGVFPVGRRGARLIERQPAVRFPRSRSCRSRLPTRAYGSRHGRLCRRSSVSLDGPRRREAAGLGLVDHRNLRRERPRRVVGTKPRSPARKCQRVRSLRRLSLNPGTVNRTFQHDRSGGHG